MKVLVVALCCAFAGVVTGSTVAWPGAVALSSPLALSSVHSASPVIKTLLPSEAKATGYSTTQYINAIPTSYAYGPQPHYAIPLATASGFASYQPGYHSILGTPFLSGNNVYYPSQAFSPVIPGFGPGPVISGFPAESPSSPSGPFAPAFPSGPSNQLPGDADSAVIESALSQPEQPMPIMQNPSGPLPTRPPQASPAPPQSSIQPGASSPSSQHSSLPLSPANTFPNIPDFSQLLPGNPGFPSITDIGQNLPQTPSLPQFPQFPSNLFPQGPSQAPPSSFPSAVNSDKGLNDADTISVESA